jgi:hypothetical protein
LILEVTVQEQEVCKEEAEEGKDDWKRDGLNGGRLGG